jgi:hypothetical protein
MTTEAREHGERTRPSAAPRLGALAGVTPVVMFLAWNAISGWGGTPIQFAQSMAVISVIAIVAGWIVGGRSDRSIRSVILDTVGFAVVAWLLVLPIGVVGSTWTGVVDGSLGDPAAVVISTFFLLLYGAVSGIYLIPFLTPLGAGWSLTYYLLRRGMHV